MNTPEIVNAWKRPDARSETAAAVAHPSGPAELGEHDLAVVLGGEANATRKLLSLGCCDGLTSYPSCWGSCGCPPGDPVTSGNTGPCTKL